MTAPAETFTHPIPPFWMPDSSILILGSFPSVKSREEKFFYAHPLNRFWRTLAGLFGAPLPCGRKEKEEFLVSHRISLWDVIKSCRISSSSDGSIRDAKPNDIRTILEKSSIKAIFTNGKTAERLYRKYIFPQTGKEAVLLPSTSPAYASVSAEQLLGIWRERISAAVPDFLPSRI